MEVISSNCYDAALYQDQVKQAGLEAWAKLDEGLDESPIPDTMQ